VFMGSFVINTINIYVGNDDKDIGDLFVHFKLVSQRYTINGGSL